MDPKLREKYKAMGIEVSLMTQEEANDLGTMIYLGGDWRPSRNDASESRSKPPATDKKGRKKSAKALRDTGTGAVDPRSLKGKKQK
jgi:hypothetical protein